MHMRIVWGKILPGQWDAFEMAFTKALKIRGEVKGLKSQWLLRDQNDPDAGCWCNIPSVNCCPVGAAPLGCP
jgi:hypothetical protein